MSVQRCGWCITGDHAHCVVVVEMGIKAAMGPKQYQLATAKSKHSHPYFWRCGCECEWALDTKCVQCQRVGVKVVENRCVSDCSHIKPGKRPKVRGE